LKEQKIAIDAQEAGMQANMQAYQKEEDRNAKRALKAMDVLADLIKTQEANGIKEVQLSTDILNTIMKNQQGN
jgi:hypothetical protein